MKDKRNQKGFTLIEVAASLTLLVIVTTGMVTLIASVLRLNLTARARTQAIAYAQEGLARGVSVIKNSCQVAFSTHPVNNINPSSTFRLDVTVEKGYLGGDPMSFSADPNGNIARVISTVDWMNSGDTPPAVGTNGDNTYKLYQLITTGESL